MEKQLKTIQDTPPNRRELTEIVGATRRQLESQSLVPDSPGKVEGNETLLCAGAAFVKEAALGRRSSEFAEKFAQEVVAQESSYILDVAASIGLNDELVERIILTNDALPPAKRLAGTLACLDGVLRSQDNGRRKAA